MIIIELNEYDLSNEGNILRKYILDINIPTLLAQFCLLHSCSIFSPISCRHLFFLFSVPIHDRFTSILNLRRLLVSSIYTGIPWFVLHLTAMAYGSHGLIETT